ncbi:hypothetical protein [Vulcanisaeta sp. JCM 14467]|uniref:hypothetical protein n=1 Tax=Vulcanisaeta sp. JCM 14467 TaxID=1295370 RepID=UPI0006D22D86|nr:hypothetical protein [Vulcanisaeta sp. JCM 14467]
MIIATSARARGKYADDEAVIVMDPGIAPGGFAWIFPRGMVSTISVLVLEITLHGVEATHLIITCSSLISTGLKARRGLFS